LRIVRIFINFGRQYKVGENDIMRKKIGLSAIAAKRRVAILQSRQKKLWRVNLILGVILFFILSVWWIGVEAGVIAPPSAQTEETMEIADLIAILIFAIELYGRYKKSQSKTEFLKNNWLEILAILPIGLIFRAGRVLEEIAIFRSLRLGINLGEAPMVIPEVVLLSGKSAGRMLLSAHNWLAHYSVFADVFELVARWKKLLLG